MAIYTTQDLRNQVIYSIYVRNYSEQGDFAAVECDLDRIKNLGVDIIWFLPIYPIGKVKRKGVMGSPYAIADYRKVNPELGTMDDFRKLVQAIHDRGMKCMIDVVYNHTSPDSWLVRNHPEYFYTTPSGELGNRVGDWGDIVDLDYANQELWQYQIETLKMWAEIVDGFRCDVAPLVPLKFWQKAREEVEAVRGDLIWLSESVEPEFILELRARGMTNLSDSEIFQVFDICYDYDIHKFFQGYLSGKNSLSKYAEYVNMQEYIYPDNYVKLRFLENHDQERARKIIPSEQACLNWTVFMYFQKGATLIYAGQENQNQKRPDLFNKDVINMDGRSDISLLLCQLYKIKKLPIMTRSSYCLKALNEQGVLIAEHKAIDNSDRLIGIFSFEEKEGVAKVELKDGIYQNLITGDNFTVLEGNVDLKNCPVVIEVRSKK